ncbi:hypothetical protein AUP68_05652 [Ilyonectria robusta]
MRQFFHDKRNKYLPIRQSGQPGGNAATAASSSSAKTFPVGIKCLHRSAEDLVDIVFVHGLSGHRERTWTASGESDPWPKTLLPSKLPNARILTFGYNAYVTSWQGIVSQDRLGSHAGNLLNSLASYREDDKTNDRPIIFVCHSLGGLVCEDALIRSNERPEAQLRNIIHCTRGIIFLGTPHHGSGLATWAERMSLSINVIKQTNSKIVEVLRRDSEVLARIQESFHTMVLARNKTKGYAIEITCFYEQLPLPRIGFVVPQDSATLPGYNQIGIHGNHKQMIKFSEAHDPGFMAICGELKRWVGSLATPDGRDISRNPETHKPKATSRHFLVPYTCNSDFVGRSGILEQLKSQLGHNQPESQRKSQARVSLHGLGGIGKTQIALAYAYWLQDEHPEVSVFWVHASNAERFRQAFAYIAQECQIPGYDDSKTDMLQLVKTWLERRERGNWLMIIDNADDAQVFFSQSTEPANAATHQDRIGRYIPECAHGSLLITTRNLMAASRLTKGNPTIGVGNMDESESAQLLRTRLGGIEYSSTELSILSSRLEYLPLALAQAAAFIQENALQIKDYLQLLGHSDQTLVDLLSEEFETTGRETETPRAVAETWALSFQQIEKQNSLAGELLSFMCLLDRQDIPMEFLFHYTQKDHDGNFGSTVTLTKALGILKAFSFIAEGKDEHLNMHRLVQLVTRKWLTKKNTVSQFTELAILAVSAAYPESHYENRALSVAYLPHVQSVLNLKGTDSRDENIAKATLLHRVAGFSHWDGQWSEAEELSAQALATRRQLLGEEHPDTLASMGRLALIFEERGRWKEAEELHLRKLEISKRVLGEQNLETLNTMVNLGFILGKQGKFREAEELQSQALGIQKRVVGKEHPDTLTSMSDLALTLKDQGRWGAAEEMQLQVLEIRKRLYGKEHPHTLASMNNLASTFLNQGRWGEAEEMQIQVLKIRKRLLGKEHPLTLTSMNNLASTFMSQGRWGEAEEMQLQVLEIRKRLYGKEHPHTLASMNNLASTFLNQGRWGEAEEMQIQVLEIRKRLLGKEHPHTLTGMNNLAYTWKSMGKSEEALDLMLDCVRLSKKILGPDHPHTMSPCHAVDEWRSEAGLS